VCVCGGVSVTLSVNSPTGQTPQRIVTVYARMCLLGVSMMNNHIYGSKVSQNSYFGGLNRHFKPNMRKIQTAISSDLCFTLTWSLTGQQQRLHEWSRMVVKQFQDGGRPPFLKSIYCHISVKNHRIFMKFCTQQQILNWINVTWSKMKISKIQDGGEPPFWKSLYRHTPANK